MRTTLSLDDDVLEAVRALAKERGAPIGTVISELVRKSLTSSRSESRRNGILLFPVRQGAGPVTPELVKALFEENE
jgi:hypothetical protein